ncbi:MAG: hypothetical protein ACLFV2_08195 [Desulfurivibrionaceae bacterium]
MMKCWICNDPVDTREHVIKQSDIRRLFGRGPYPKGKRLKRTDQNQTKKIIQSEDSIHIKYQKSLCKHCNSTRSQPWDRAYDEFMEYILNHAPELKQKYRIGFKAVTQTDINKFTSNLYSFFIKAFGCQLQEHGQKPPLELSEFLLGKNDNTKLKVSFAIYESMPQDLTSPMIQIHNLDGDFDNFLKKPVNYTWAVSIEWLTICFWFNKEPSEDLGLPFIGNVDSISIGSYK